MTYEVGDYVVHDLYKDAIWQIELLGDESFYANGSQLSEDSSKLVLYLPAPNVPRQAYPNWIWAFRKEFGPANELLVIARTSDEPLSSTKELLLRNRHKRKRRKAKRPDDGLVRRAFGR